MKKNKFQLIRIGLLGTALAAVILTNNLLPRTAFAVGELTIDWGAPSGDPIFVVNNMAPGDCETRTVNVLNSSVISRDVAVRGEETNEVNDLGSVLEIEIVKVGTGTVYGPVTLDEFFTDSALSNAIALSTHAAGEDFDYDFTVCFPEDAGNEFQNASVVFDLSIGINIPTPAECDDIDIENVIFGTAGNDRISGTTDNDLIFLLEGNDRVDGEGGDDCIVGGSGNDRVSGGTGKDVILGEEGNDDLNGGSNDDVLIGGEGNDRLDGGSGNDTLNDDIGNDKIDGGSGDDQINSGVGEDNIDGGSGNDVIHAGDQNDLIEGGSGNDQLFGEAGNDNLKGGSGADLLNGGVGTNVLNGNSGTDRCINGAPKIKCEVLI